jgi:sigma-E factor negative regulatory protein RseB
VLQAVFSDGLTHVSMFIEAIDRQRHRQPLLTQMGATHTLMQAHGGDWWVTVMGDVPASTLKQFYQALERRR